ncbi:hypothetical protein E1176_08915 [Fulvivirga sp. RKSG066]|uniref:Calx-beta domain-containing protein n=1 Tax=Fulvivirga aurantia TaxID=2529383 RepID=UPI0012BC1C58|nr:Calx-beta domain-containing protein [Fulvivirga aurantia]MTI21139.1 hypothetical protein [Fulvivirga aurantia]
MKIINKFSLFLIAFAVIFTSACDEEDGRTTFEGPFYVQYTGSSASVSEADTTTVIKVEVSNVGPTLNSDIIVNYTVEGDAEVGVDYEILRGGTPGQIVIPAGEHFGVIELRTINNDETDGNKSIDLTLTSANNGLEVGRGAIGTTYSLSISDDDCPFDITTFPGTYNVSWVQSSGWIWDAGENTGYVSNLTATSETNVFGTDNLLGATDGGQNDVQVVNLVVDVDAETVGIDNSNGPQEFYKNTSDLQRYAVGTGEGAVGTCGPTFSFSYDVLREDQATVAVSVTATYEKAN